MRVPFSLSRAAGEAPVTGLLLPSEDVAGLLGVCERLGQDAPPVIYRVPGGFLLEPARPVTGVVPGAIRLRGLAGHLYVPVEGELVPPLLADEAAGLVRDRGLVFLPGGLVLSYDPARPVRADTLLAVNRLPPRPWQPLPERPPLPGRLREIRLDVPEESPEAILGAGGEGIGLEEPRPAGAGPAATVAGHAAAAAGKGLLWLGNLLGWRRLARLGAALVGSAVSMVPRVSEAVIGRQEAALRELLRWFQEGKIEEALRRALPLGGPGDRGGTPAQDAELPRHGLRYRLADFLRGGPARLWFGGAEAQSQLAAEYRKAAQAAVARGDYRRAAFIYGKLLGDFHAAAAVLAQGGLHHDAAILYLEKLGDTRAAARAFEAAGEVDRALELYRQRGDQVAAGDLLRRAGEEEAAVWEYLVAAQGLAAAGNQLEAGEVLLNLARRSDLALDFFRAGWAGRPQGGAVACLLAMTELYAGQDSPAALLALAGEADTFFALPGNEVGAGQFYNRLAELAGRDHLAAVRDELRDRALRGLALKLRQQAAAEARPGTVVSSLLARSGAWPAPVVSDAEYAWKAAVRRHGTPGERRVDHRPLTRVVVGTGEVTAACAAPQGGVVFLGFASGEVAWLDGTPNATGRLLANELPVWPVTSLATDACGGRLVVLHARERVAQVSSYGLIQGVYRLLQQRKFLLAAEDPWLTPVAEGFGGAVALVGFWDGGQLSVHRCADLLAVEDVALPGPPAKPSAAVFFWPAPSGAAVVRLVLCGGWLLRLGGFPGGEDGCRPLGWTPAPPAGSSLRSAVLSWDFRVTGRVEVAGVDAEGTLHGAYVRVRGTDRGELVLDRYTSPGAGYRAAAIVRPEFVAGVTARDGIHWLRRSGARLVLDSTTWAALPSAVACFPSAATNELLVVCEGGDVVRLPVPQ